MMAHAFRTPKSAIILILVLLAGFFIGFNLRPHSQVLENARSSSNHFERRSLRHGSQHVQTFQVLPNAIEQYHTDIRCPQHGSQLTPQPSKACALSAVSSEDIAYPFVVKATEAIDAICRTHNASWFMWGDTSLRLHQVGSRLLAPQYETSQAHGKTIIELYLAADSVSKIEAVWRSLAASSCWKPELSCPVNNPYGVQGGCSIISSTDGKVEIHAHGPAIIDKRLNQLRLEDSDLVAKYAFKLDRVFPLQTAVYYGLKIPVPKEPVYVFAHVVPFKTSNNRQSYKYSQDCKLIHDNIPSSIEQQTIINCGTTLQEQGVANLYAFCSRQTPTELFASFEALIKSQPDASILLLEDFKDVVVVFKGNGSYTLTLPGGTKKHPDGSPSWSQYGQDIYLDKLFNQKTNGFFLEVGGYNGETFSNTLFMEKFRNWDGLLIEAIPDLFQGILARNRKCYAINACISKEDDHLVFTNVDALSSSNKHMPERHRHRLQNELPVLKTKQQEHEAYVHCKGLTSILDQIGVHKIDYFSLDVEGSELIILNSIDWDKVDIDVFTIETDHHRNEIITFMKSKGYDTIGKLIGDDVFRKKRS